MVNVCGNSPLGILLVGGMLRNINRNWKMNSPVWIGIFSQWSLNLEEAAQLGSFKNSLTRIADASFCTINDPGMCGAHRRCFVLIVMAFRTNDWMLSGKGIPQCVLYTNFATVIKAGPSGDRDIEPSVVLSTLEHVKLLQRAGHSVSLALTRQTVIDMSDSSLVEHDDSENDDWSSSCHNGRYHVLPQKTISTIAFRHASRK